MMMPDDYEMDYGSKKMATKADIKPVVKKEVHHGTIRLQKGQKMWQLDIDTGIVSEAQFEAITFDQGKGVRKKLILKPNMLNVAAINRKNAERKFAATLDEILTNERK